MSLDANAIAASGLRNYFWTAFLAGFDSTFGITSKKFELMDISINSLRRKANPVLQCAAHLTGIGWQKRSHKSKKRPTAWAEFHEE